MDIGSANTNDSDRSWEEVEAWARSSARPSGGRLRALMTPQFIGGIVAAIALVVGGAHMASSLTPHDDVVSVESSPEPSPEAAPAASASSTPAAPAPRTPAVDAQASETPQQTRLVVHVVGQVKKPGIVDLPAGARVSDAVKAAGGPAGDADLASVNLAREATDGEQIYIPAPGETPPAPAPPSAATHNNGGSTSTEAAGSGGEGAINVNTATAAELEELPGVGPAIASRIVEHRDANGPFQSVDSLTEVKGIGDATLDKFRDRATV